MFFININRFPRNITHGFAQPAWAVEYTDCISAEG